MYVCYLPNTSHEIIKVIQKEITDYTDDLRVVKFDMTIKEEVEKARDVINLTLRRRWTLRRNRIIVTSIVPFQQLIMSRINKFLKGSKSEPLINKRIPLYQNSPQKHLLDRIGGGGNYPVECPICGESVFFKKFDVDSLQLHSTRRCNECKSVIRISTKHFHPNIFRDLGINDQNYQKMIETSVNENKIYTHGLELKYFHRQSKKLKPY